MKEAYLNAFSTTRNASNVSHDIFGGDGLAGTAFTADDDTLVLIVDEHISVHIISQRVDVRRVFVLRLQREHSRIRITYCK